LRCDQRADLAAKIVTDEEYVHDAAGGFEDAAADFEIIVNHVPHYGVDEFGFVVHLYVKILHAQQVDRVVEERRPVATENRELTVVSLGLGPDA